jgi:hypothetical protein
MSCGIPFVLLAYTVPAPADGIDPLEGTYPTLLQLVAKTISQQYEFRYPRVDTCQIGSMRIVTGTISTGKEFHLRRQRRKT